MAMPLVAIIGRPNVGKSTLFNRLTGTRIAIVEDTPGVTRDRIYANGEWERHTFTLIDTGGIEPKASGDVIMTNMRKQAELAIDMADVIVFIVDGQAGVTADDIDVANLLRRSHKPIVLAVNKIDSLKYEDALFEFCTLGIGDPMSISAEQALGLGDLLDEIVKYFPEPEENEEEDETVHIAIVGKPNVGKSSLLNALLGAERSIVSDVPGTTRDAIDTPFEHEGRKYILIDTAGIRRKSRIDDETVERYSVIRSFMAIRRADVALIVIDAAEGITEQDVKIAGYVHEEGKASAIIVNKWDSVNKDTHTVEKYKKEIYSALSFMAYAPNLFISAKTGQRVSKVMELVDYVNAQTRKRFTTGLLNDVLSEAVSVTEPPSDKGRRLKLYYGTQVAVKPPTFVLFVNDPNLMHFSYKRYMENYIRKSFKLDATPIRIYIRARSAKEDKQ